MGNYADLTNQEQVFLQTIVERAGGQHAEWLYLSTFQDSTLVAEDSGGNIDDVPSSEGFYLSLASRGYLGARRTAHGDLSVWPQKMASDFVVWSKRPAVQRFLSERLDQLAGDDPIWVKAIWMTAGIVLALVGQWLAKILGLA